MASELLELLECERLQGLLAFERQAKLEGFQKICGVDEAGRGPLAGPVIACACILPEHIYSNPLIFRNLDDSKKINPEIREELFHLLTGHPGIIYGIGQADHEEVDAVNIYQATILAMRRSVNNLSSPPDFLLVDGLKVPLEFPNRNIVKGDSLSLSIAAASVIAKVTRDRVMVACHERWPQYGFNQHKGYGTPQHLEALSVHGPCPVHRRSYSPVAASIAALLKSLKRKKKAAN